MSRDTLTLSLIGDVPIALYAKAIEYFDKLIENLSDEVVGPDTIKWEISHLQSGSAVATVRGIYHDADAVEKVVSAYGIVGKALNEGRQIPYSTEVVKSAYAITSVLNGEITSIRFSTDEIDASISAPIVEEATDLRRPSIGVVTGLLDAIWTKPLRLGVYDQLFNRIVHCYLERDQLEQREKVREAWGKRVSVIGMIKRDYETGRPMEVRQVKHIEVLEDSSPHSFRQAKGVFTWSIGDESAETMIRRVRDGHE